MSALSTTSLNTTVMFHDMTPAQQASDYMAAAWLVEQIAAQNQNAPCRTADGGAGQLCALVRVRFGCTDGAVVD